ncbi:MAG: alpha-L-fucosidase [Isosphaeraceae bacterium]
MRVSRPWLLVVALIASATTSRAQDPPKPLDRAAARVAFENARFGLYFHWGVSSLLGKGERVMERDRLPLTEYEKLPSRFNPSAFDAAAWVRAAKSAGARHLTFTAKHFDGFCLFGSELTRYDVVDATPFGKDPLKALANACHEQNMPLFLSYALLDWHHPDYFPLGKTGRFAGREPAGDWANYVAYYQGQVRELCSNYGPIAGLWFEGLWDKPDAPWDLENTYALIRELQPSALIANDHRQTPKPGEDVQVIHRLPPNAGDVAPEASLVSEFREPLSRSWGYDLRETRPRPTGELIRQLARSAGHGSNYLLGVAPLPDGGLSKDTVDRLSEVGRWLEKNGVSIQKTRPGPVPPHPWGVSTRSIADSSGSIYLHILNPEVPVVLPEALVDHAPRRLGSAKLLETRQVDGGIHLPLSKENRDPFDTVIALTPKILAPETPERIRPR